MRFFAVTTLLALAACVVEPSHNNLRGNSHAAQLEARANPPPSVATPLFDLKKILDDIASGKSSSTSVGGGLSTTSAKSLNVAPAKPLPININPPKSVSINMPNNPLLNANLMKELQALQLKNKQQAIEAHAKQQQHGGKSH